MPDQPPASSTNANSLPAESQLQPGATDAERPGFKLPPQLEPPRVLADPLREYVAGGASYAWLANYAHSLPQYIDDLTRQYGADLYERMLFDSKVASGVNGLKLAVLADGLTLTNPITDESDPQHEAAEEILAFVKRDLKRLKGPSFMLVLDQLLDGLALGHKVAEKTYEYNQEADDPDRGRLCLKSIKVKANDATAFVVDVYHNLVGMLAIVPGLGFTALTQGLVGLPFAAGYASVAGKDGKPVEVQLPPNFLPREKFVVFSFRPKDTDPRGRSLLRAAYDPWWCKQQVKQEYLKYLAQFAVPGLVGTTADQDQDVPKTDALGNVLVGEDGQEIMITPVEAMMEALSGFKNGGIIALPYGATVTPIQVAGNGEAFTAAFNFYNQEIDQAITSQSLATSEAQFQAKASSDTHENRLDALVQYIKNQLKECVQDDILYWMVFYNFGKEAADTLTPDVSFSQTQQPDFAGDAAAIASLQSSGFLHDSQLPGLDAKLGLPERDYEAQMAEKEANRQMQQQALQAKRGGNSNSGQGDQEDGKPGSDQSAKKEENGQKAKPGDTD